MTYYVIITQSGAYVAPRGSERSYTRQLQDARTFTSFDAAARECCEGEYPVELSAAMKYRDR